MSTVAKAFGRLLAALDIDIVLDMRPELIEAFSAELGGEFYADAGMIREAFARGRAANIIHTKSAWKFDLFPLRRDEYSRTEFGRRAMLPCAHASAEDTILRNLEWYLAGGERSERQWNDLLGVCRTAASRLDLPYLHHWAQWLKVDALLNTLLAESGIPPPESNHQ